jgi:UDPglucose--hexose-1-phosphate uridylyltransferase
MSGGLFELRRDSITGWWVATLVGREFEPERFLTRAEPVDDRGDCFNCRIPPGDGVRTRVLRDFAFRTVGTEAEARAMEKSVAQIALSQARAAGSWRTIVAPPGEHRPLHSVGVELIAELLRAARDALLETGKAGQTAYLQVLQNWGRQAGARTNHLCLDLYDLPQVPHEVAEEIGGAARFVIRESECPYCRAIRLERERSSRFIWEDEASLAFAPFASRSPFEVWIVPRRHESDFGRATDAAIASLADGLRQVLGRLGLLLGGPPYNLVLHTAPLAGQVDATYHWHWEIHPRLREIAGLELGTGLPVNSVSPEEAADQLVRRPGLGADGQRPGLRSELAGGRG